MEKEYDEKFKVVTEENSAAIFDQRTLAVAPCMPMLLQEVQLVELMQRFMRVKSSGVGMPFRAKSASTRYTKIKFKRIGGRCS